MWATAILALSTLTAQFLADLEIQPLSFDAKEFKTAFNNSKDRFRLVAVFSPT